MEGFMIFRTLIVCFFVLFITGCDGPAENAGEDLDAKVTAALDEVAELKRQIEGYKQTIKDTRDELAASKEQLTIAQKEMEELKQSRQEVLQQMNTVQGRPQTEAVSVEQENASIPATAPDKTPAESGNAGQ
jgi:chromosome segregation ATPase